MASRVVALVPACRKYASALSHTSPRWACCASHSVLSVSSRFLLVLQPLSSRSSAANDGLIVGTAVAARGLHEPQQRGYGTSGPTALAERQRSLVGRSEDRHWGLGSSSGVRRRARPECVAQSDRARRPAARLAAERRADPECTARLAARASATC